MAAPIALPNVAVVGPRRRNTELLLVIVALFITGGAYTLASLGRRQAIPANVGPFLGVMFVLLVGAHLATRRWAPQADGVILPVAILLNGLGYVMIARLDEALAAKQAGWTAVGIAAYVVTLIGLRRVRSLQRIGFTCGLVGVALLLLPMVPKLGVSKFGARIWVEVGAFSLQPGEFAKLALAVFFAAYLVERREMLAFATRRIGPIHVPEPRLLVPVIMAWGFALVVMVFQKDLGSALLFFLLFMVLIWVATERIAYPLIGLAMFAVAAYFSWRNFGHVQTRVTAWLNPWKNEATGSYQVIQGTYSLAWGGLTGTGLGAGMPGRVPVASSDMIYAAIGEELGMLGATAVMAAYLLIAGAGMRIATVAKDPFQKILATGLSALIAIQAFVIMGGVLRVLPLTGVTLPFVSYGGSSLIANYVLLAVLMRISDESARGRPLPATARRGILAPRLPKTPATRGSAVAQ